VPCATLGLSSGRRLSPAPFFNNIYDLKLKNYMRNLYIICIIFIILLFPVKWINASSMKDADHGDISCLGCHPDVGSEENSHSGLSCLDCHGKTGEFSHDDQIRLNCKECHYPHDEKIAHDPHFSVACEACHLSDVKPLKVPGKSRLLWERDCPEEGSCDVHRMLRGDEADFCVRCHHKDNKLGAAARVLPAKGIICMPCHSATFSVDDITTALSVLFFLFGSAGIILIWLTGRKSPEKRNQITIRKIFEIKKAIVLDGFLQRRLFLASKSRWIIHAMIFFPLVLRFIWGLCGLISSLFCPEWSGIEIILNKNHPITAFFFDITGVIILLGGCCMLLRKKIAGTGRKLPGLPKTDIPAYCLMGMILITGFILEGMRIGMTGSPEGSEYAFLGYAISRLFLNFDLTNIYGYMWYFHAVVTGAFVAYLPFSRMLHIIIAPASVAIGAASRD
jgi:nitrate reductase gamma subunit